MEYPEPLCSQVPIRHNRSRCSLLFRLKLDSFGNPSEKNTDAFRKSFRKTLWKRSDWPHQALCFSLETKHGGT